jgi:hypothetical protein
MGSEGSCGALLAHTLPQPLPVSRAESTPQTPAAPAHSDAAPIYRPCARRPTWNTSTVGSKTAGEGFGGADSDGAQNRGSYRIAAASRAPTGAFSFSSRINSRIQDGWPGQARADTITPSTTASESTNCPPPPCN